MNVLENNTLPVECSTKFACDPLEVISAQVQFVSCHLKGHADTSRAFGCPTEIGERNHVLS